MDPRNRTDGVASTRQEYEDWAAAMVMPRSDRILDCWALSAWEEATKRVEARNISKRLLFDLLAIIHCDGGNHTHKVGVARSVEDAKRVIYGMKDDCIEGPALLAHVFNQMTTDQKDVILADVAEAVDGFMHRHGYHLLDCRYQPRPPEEIQP